MASTEDICSLALGLIGENPITDINDTGVLSVRCKQLFSIQRDALLRLHDWGFASRRIPVAVSSTTPVFGYVYAYDLPGENLKVREVYPECGFVVEGRQVLSNDLIESIRYTARVEESGYFDSLFVATLSAHLAVVLCFPLKKSAALLKSMENLAEGLLSKAQVSDCQEGTPQVDRESSSWLDAR